MAYQEFAYFYDELMDDFTYEELFGHLDKALKASPGQKVLELAAGTGQVSMHMARQGYAVLATDASEDMLIIAREKAMDHQMRIVFLQQDMNELMVKGKFHSVVCCTDGINYITDQDALRKLFKKIYHELLVEEGLFFFDISSAYKLSKVLGDEVFVEQRESITYIWENYYDEASGLLSFDFTLFIEEEDSGLFERIVEKHVQRAYNTQELISLLEEIGFKDVALMADNHQPQAHRYYFIARR